MKLLAAAALCVAFVAWVGTLSQPELQPDERVTLYPGFGSQQSDGSWLVHVDGSVWEDERNTTLHGLLVAAARAVAGGSLDMGQREVFSERVGLFLRDLERGKQVPLSLSAADGRSLAVEVLESPATKPNGLFRQRLRVLSSSGGWLRVFSPHEPDSPSAVHLLPDRGLSVISDIDDTIKVTGVLDSAEMLRNTFMLPFRAIPGMAEAYQRWEREGVAFHYVSGSPWQLQGELSAWMERDGFPQGSWHLKPFRLEIGEDIDASMFDMFSTPLDFKLANLARLLETFPDRRFAFVGDSGEFDPEVYGMTARRFPGQLAFIAIHDLEERPMDAQRRAEAFAGVPEDRVFVFSQAGQLPESALWFS